jgi:hypothetical protein
MIRKLADNGYDCLAKGANERSAAVAIGELKLGEE